MLISRGVTHLLQPRDLVKCRHCQEWHPVGASNPDAGTPYERNMLYITCGESVYFVGTIGSPSRQPAKRPD
jgi:hypothetical protein